MKDKITLINTNPTIRYSIDDVIEARSIRSCHWWRNLPVFYEAGIKSVKDFTANLNKLYKVGPGQTAKVCPGIKELLKNSVVLKMPLDVSLKVMPNGDIYVHTADEALKNIIDIHPQKQFTSDKSNLFKNKVNIKFTLPYTIYSKNAHCIILDPFYHNDNIFKIMPGVIKWNKNFDKIDANINTFCEVNGSEVDIFIPKGTAIAYLYFFNGVEIIDKVTSIKDTDRERPLHTSFTNSNFY